MRIGIVDDETEELEVAAKYIGRHLNERYPKEEALIDTFTDAETLLENFCGQYDLLLFDICLEGMSGIKAAQYVRERDESVAIIFLTASADYMLEGYGVFAVGYILKPLELHKDAFAKIFAHVFPRLRERHKKITVRSGGISLTVPYRNIYFVDIDWRRRLCLHLAGEKILLSMAYIDIQKELLADPHFLECHHRIIVNMEKISSMEKEEFFLENGDRVPISQRKQKEAKAKYMHYLTHK